MNHPQSCPNPDTCSLSYVDHLRSVQIAPTALPTRAVNRTPGQADEPMTATVERQKRWDRENQAYKTLANAGIPDVPFKDAPKVLEGLGG